MSATATAITKQSNTSFYYSFSLLPRPQREALHTVYAFCRATDDLVDEERDVQTRTELLGRWRRALAAALQGRSTVPLLSELATTARSFNIPVDHFYDLIRGVEMDLSKSRYETFEELYGYCYLVASTVGLMCRKIFGSKNEATRAYAVNLGIALQLTNILRDVKDDAARGRIYLPLEELRRFGVTEEDILTGRYTPEFVELMRFQVERARTYFRRAQDALGDDDKGFFFAARIMWSIYAHLLNRIERSGYNVFARRITIPRVLRVMIAIRYWLSHQIRYRPRMAAVR
jgi:phytoene synthase